jgi:hypothetical protein
VWTSPTDAATVETGEEAAAVLSGAAAGAAAADAAAASAFDAIAAMAGRIASLLTPRITPVLANAGMNIGLDFVMSGGKVSGKSLLMDMAFAMMPGGEAERGAASAVEDSANLEKDVSLKGTGNVKPKDFSPLAPDGGLAAHEARGGHLIARHVGKTDAELLQRLKDNPKVTGASTFKDRATAEKVASEVLNDPNNQKIIQSWLSNPKSKSTLVLPYQGAEIIGRGVQRGSTTVEHMTNAKIVLKKDGAGDFILTGYPTK